MAKPLLPHIGVLAFVPDDWGPHWESRHHMMSRLAAYFNVVWLEPSHGWRDSIRILVRRGRLEPEPPEGLHVHRPDPWLPRFYRTAWLDHLARDARLRNARKRLASLGCSKLVLHIWRPDFLFALETIPADFTLYHVDDEYSFSDVEPSPKNEAILLERADQVIVHSTALLQKKGGINPHTALIPNGVDFAEYAIPHSQPPDIARIPPPRIGYSGHLKRQLDWRVIGDLVRRHPEWSFVFVGAVRPHPEVAGIINGLSSYANVHFLGAKTVHELAKYPQHFDCCIMPYAETSYTSCMYPMKLHEYLASGRPAVGAPIPALEEFSHVMELARTPEEWSTAIQHALSPAANTPDKRQERQAIARQHDWDALAFRVATIIADGLGETIVVDGSSVA